MDLKGEAYELALERGATFVSSREIVLRAVFSIVQMANDFNTQTPLQSSNRGDFDAFVTKLTPTSYEKNC